MQVAHRHQRPPRHPRHRRSQLEHLGALDRPRWPRDASDGDTSTERARTRARKVRPRVAHGVRQCELVLVEAEWRLGLQEEEGELHRMAREAAAGGDGRVVGRLRELVQKSGRDARSRVQRRRQPARGAAEHVVRQDLREHGQVVRLRARPAGAAALLRHRRDPRLLHLRLRLGDGVRKRRVDAQDLRRRQAEHEADCGP
mmetsp:Transcript_5238/g.13657  ORF Transcript_5238/g.13657 Transcript_5238/m.13657 type:complete len:200 (-) Transcript_5238:48-647(-)